MKVIKFNNISFLFIVFLISFGEAQNDVYKFNHITDANGLSQNSVIAMHQDKLGQMWIGTRDGLNKYDGEQFTVFKHEKSNPNSITNNSILCIEEDRNGFIWIGTSFGLNRYNPKKNEFKAYFVNKQRTFIGSNMISVVKEMANDEIWIGSASGISIYNVQKDEFESVLEKKNITSVLETKSGKVVVGTTSGLLILDDKTRNVFNFYTVAGTEDLDIQDIVESNNGNILIATKNESILEFEITKNSIKPYFDKALLKGKSKNVRSLLFDDLGQLWLATYNGLQISSDRNKLMVLYSDDNDEKSINDNFIKTLFKDNIGVLWVGTYYGGVNICSDFNKNFINITQKYSKAGLSFKVVSSLVNYKNLLFIGTAGGGISVLNKENNSIEHINTKNSIALKSDNIKSLCITNDDKLWIGTFENGVAIYNLKTKLFEELPFSEKLKALLKDVGVLSLSQYDSNYMLIGTNVSGLIKYNIRQNTYRVFSSYSKTSALTNGNIKTIHVSKKGDILVGTLRGLNCISADGIVTNYIYSKDQKIKFEITSIYESQNDVLWIGTAEDGLFKFANNQFEPIHLKVNNEEINAIRGIVEAELGHVWISTYTQGLIKFNLTQKKIVSHYTKKDGLPSNQFNRDAYLKIGTSYYFGGPSGVTFFNEKNLIKNNYAPQVIITDFKIKNNSIDVNEDQNILETALSYTRDIELVYNQGNFSLMFAMPNFINSSSNSYLYRLQGLENDWVETSTNVASYTIQKSGNYKFEVKGVNSDGVINEIPTTLNIVVKPAPWATWWAYSLYGLLIIGTLYYLYNTLKSKTKLKHQLELEHVKTEQIEEINKSKLEFFTNISHEFRTPLTLILGSLQQVLDDYQGSSKMFKKLKVVESSSNQLLKLINRLMDFRKYENRVMKLEVAKGDIVNFVEEIYLSFSEYAKEKKHTYNFSTSAKVIDLYFDNAKLERVFYNLISNAFKYTPNGGEISVEIEDHEKLVLILIKDTGIGIPAQFRSKVFDRFFEISKHKLNNEHNQGTGIGLSIVKSIIDLHKGTIYISEQTKTTGTVFTLELPKGKTHLKSSEIVEDFKQGEDVSYYQSQLKAINISHLDENFFNEIPSQHKASILVVEDNKELRTFIRNLLSSYYNVFEAGNGKEGYKMAIKHQVDLIISDVVMPITSGTELCAMIKEDIRTSHIPVILLTTRSALVYKLEGLETGADDYISKPFNLKEFKLRISNILASNQRLKDKINANEILKPEDMVMSSMDEELYKKALNIVEKNLGNDTFDIPYFCEELGVSKSVLYIKVKAWTDFTPKQFIVHLRLKYAAQLLEQGKMNINEVSRKAGFKNQKYFAKIFKNKFGKTPSDYAQSFTEF
ncbi:hybrid sensor histidine kinase/response regulator [Hyunsoonleella pacifica]|nr:hybrid sensor histidine kinase/response regulator [Hyunsoonleella pacifica]